jgi:hypothetical protein
MVFVDVFFWAQWLEPEMLGLGGVGGHVLCRGVYVHSSKI